MVSNAIKQVRGVERTVAELQVSEIDVAKIPLQRFLLLFTTYLSPRLFGKFGYLIKAHHSFNDGKISHTALCNTWS